MYKRNNNTHSGQKLLGTVEVIVLDNNHLSKKLFTSSYHISKGKIVLLFLLLATLTIKVSGSDNSIKSLFTESRVINTLQYSDLFNFRIANDMIVLQEGPGYTENTVIRILETNTLEEKWSRRGPCQFYNLSIGRNPSVVFCEVLHEGILNAHIYDLNDGFLFSVMKYRGELFPSPNGAYFYSNYSQVNVNRFEVYDRSGNLLFYRPNPRYGWYATAFDDSTIAYVTPREIIFISVPSGEEIKTLQLPKPSRGSCSISRIAKDGGYMILSSFRSGILFINPEMEIGWHLENEFPYRNSAFSNDGEYVAIYSGSRGNYVLEFIGTQSGNILWSQKISSKDVSFQTRYPNISIVNDYITLISPPYDFYAKGEINESTETFIFKYNISDGSLSQFDVFEGVFNFHPNGKSPESFITYDGKSLPTIRESKK